MDVDQEIEGNEGGSAVALLFMKEFEKQVRICYFLALLFTCR